MKPLKFEVQPSKSLGPFVLGLPIIDVINLLSKQRHLIPKIDFKYSKVNPLSFDLELNFSENGFLIKFDPPTQRLKLIEIYDFTRLDLSYLKTTFSKKSPSILPTFLQIYNTFGPTYPGEYDESSGIYTLSYPGVSFTFPIPSQHASLYTEKSEQASLPIEFPDGKTPVCTKMYIYMGKSLNQIIKVPTFASEKFRNLKYYYELVTVRGQSGLYFESRKKTLKFGMEAQEVIADFGLPSEVFFKKDKKLSIHSSVTEFDEKAGSNDYFFNYFDLGFDILFDAETHVIKRLFLHTNLPGHGDFNMYRKCNFRIVMSSTNQKDVLHENGLDQEISCDMRWDDIQIILGKPKGDPLIFNKDPASSKIFGPTRFFGYQNLIFEVAESLHISSLIVYSERDLK